MIQPREEQERETISKACDNGQEHLFRFWDQLDDREKDRLIRDIRDVDFSVVKQAVEKMQGGVQKTRHVSPPEIIGLPSTPNEMEQQEKARAAGSKVITDGRVAVFTAAGGQSSRLGIDFPKGAFPVTPLREKSLFQVSAEKIIFMQKKFGVTVDWIIMVSETNHDQTREFFRSNGFFGLDENSVRFIVQGMNPAIDREGKIFLAEKHRVFLSPNGHGGVFAALRDSGTIAWLRERGRDTVFYFQIDNVLVDILDPVFIGYHVQNRCDMSSKCVNKLHPGEKMGAFVNEGGRTAIVEYTEVDSVIVEGDQDRDHALRAGNVAIHVIDLGFVERVTEGELRLPLHIAHKAIPHVDSSGNKVEPDSPNGYKIETFIFDALHLTDDTIIMETRRSEEFSPLKNRSGADSIETVERDQVALFAGWLEHAGIEVPRENSAPRFRIEVSPLFAPTGQEFLDRAGELEVDRIEGDTYVE